VPGKRRWIRKQIGRFLEIGITPNGKAYGIMYLQVEKLGDGCFPGEILPVPFLDRFFIRIKIEEGKAVCSLP